MIVINRVMPGCTVIPEGDGTRLPAEFMDMFGASRVAHQIINQGLAFRSRPAVEMGGKTTVNIKRPAAADRMANNHRVNRVLACRVSIFASLFWPY